MRLFYCLLSVVFLSSCSFVLKKVAGIRDPELESHSALNDYAKTLGVHTSDLVFVKDTSAITVVEKMFGGSPEILIFDNKKNYHPYKMEGVSCNAPIDLILTNICNANALENVTGRPMSYDLLISKLDDPNKVLSEFELSSVDFIVFINYLKYAGKVTKSHIVPWAEIVYAPGRSCKVKYVFIDYDFLDTWGLSKKDLPKIKVKS
jgi:hypothetical protein